MEFSPREKGLKSKGPQESARHNPGMQSSAARMVNPGPPILCFAIFTHIAQAAETSGTSGKAGACRYRPGTPFTAAIRLSVSDNRVRADSATVEIHTTIPSGGRMAGSKGKSRYIATLDPVPVRLAKDTIKHLDLAASVIVENPDSADCQVKLDLAVSSRSWAKQQTSNFSFRSDVVVPGAAHREQRR
jgi:hypothetical protein